MSNRDDEITVESSDMGNDIQRFMDQLSPYIDRHYAEFLHKLVPNTRYPIAGVRVPVLRKLAKQWVKAAKDIEADIHDQHAMLTTNDASYEMVMLHLLIIAYSGGTLQTLQERALPSLRLIDNWGLCDTFAVTFAKPFHRSDEGYHVICQWAISPEIWTSRVGLVMSLSLKAEYQTAFLDFLKDHATQIQTQHEPVSMGLAWVLSQYYGNHSTLMLQLMRQWPFDLETLKRTRQKIRESKRYTSHQKSLI